MAVIRSVSSATTIRLFDCIIAGVQESNRCSPRKCSGLASCSFAARRKQLKKFRDLKRGFNFMGFEGRGSESFGMIQGWSWKEWRRILSPAEFLGQWGCSAGGQISAVDHEEMGLMEGDVVEYPLAVGLSAGAEGNVDYDRRIGVGVIVDMFKDSDSLLCQIEPLCQEDPDSKEWIHDELQPEIIVPIGQIRALRAWYSQRMVPDRISNPHGEHAENLWTLE